MKAGSVTYALLMLAPLCVYSAESYYCPQKSGTIRIGMSIEDVVAACGSPLSKTESDEPLMVKVPVQQLIYNSAGIDTAPTDMFNNPEGTAFYGVWNIANNSNLGTELEFDIVNNKVREVRVNGDNTNAASLCNANIQIGDDVAKVYNFCGGPSVVNNSYINQMIYTSEKPQVWIYQSSQYVKPVSLTFVNGKLQSIN